MKSFPRSGAFVALAALTICFGTWSARSEAGIVLTAPASLGVGDTVRFVFVTNGVRDARSNSASDYDSFVNAEVATYGGATFMGQQVTGWKAIVSAADNNGRLAAQDHIGTVSGLKGIYLPDGTWVADNEAKLWNEGAADLHAAITQLVNGSNASGSNEVWTGTGGYGLGVTVGNGVAGLGSDGDEPVYDPEGTGSIVDYAPAQAVYGFMTYTNAQWINRDSADTNQSHRLYAISPALIVTAVAAPVPEIDPATGSSALSLVAGVLAMVEQRRRRGLKAGLAG